VWASSERRRVIGGRTAIRFSHYEIRHEPRRLAATLVKPARRLRP